jgi:hypothetical protein
MTRISWETRLPVRLLKGTLVDIETTGLPSNPSAEVITMGFIVGDRLQILQRTKEDHPSQLPRKISSLPRPLYAFNKGFEEYFLKTEFEKEIQVRPFEKKREAIHIEGVRDPFDGEGLAVTEAWKAYLGSCDPFYITRIMHHNFSCLVSELCLVLVRHTCPKILQGALVTAP